VGGNETVTGTLTSGALTVNGTATVNGNATITGTIQIQGGAPANGKVLTSDGSGNAFWDYARYAP
jgi:hypothetical protein